MAATEILATLPGIEAHPHARAVLAPALTAAASPSHAYLFHGPPGTGKRSVARAFAAALLAGGDDDARAVRERVERGTHPDLTWVVPSGAAEMLVGDIDEAVVVAAARTPFESARRVFVIEGAETMNDQVANRLLKTLEEPAAFVHLILLAERRQDVLATVASRCQSVRFDPPPPAAIERDLRERGIPAEEAAACAHLALGDPDLAVRLAEQPGRELRAGAEAFVRSALQRDPGSRPWNDLLAIARAAGERAAEQVAEQAAAELELIPAKERRRHEREAGEAARRVERRERTRTLDLALGLAERWLRDLWLIAEGAPELVHAKDRREQLERDGLACAPGGLGEAVELLAATRLRLGLNVSEELALEALSYRLGDLLR